MKKKERCSCGAISDSEGMGPFTGSSDMCPKCRAEYVSRSMYISIFRNQKEIFLNCLRKLTKEQIIALLSVIEPMENNK